MVGTKIHANLKKDLRRPKSDKKILYGGGMFHIIKKDKLKRKQ